MVGKAGRVPAPSELGGGARGPEGGHGAHSGLLRPTGAHLLLSKAGHTSSFSPHHRAPHRAPGRPRWFAPSPYPESPQGPLGTCAGVPGWWPSLCDSGLGTG